MKEPQEILKEDKRLLEVLVKEAKTNDKKIMVYSFLRRISAKNGPVSFKKEWHVMKEGNRTSKKFQNKSDAIIFDDKISKNSGKIYVSR